VNFNLDPTNKRIFLVRFVKMYIKLGVEDILTAIHQRIPGTLVPG